MYTSNDCELGRCHWQLINKVILVKSDITDDLVTSVYLVSRCWWMKNNISCYKSCCMRASNPKLWFSIFGTYFAEQEEPECGPRISDMLFICLLKQILATTNLIKQFYKNIQIALKRIRYLLNFCSLFQTNYWTYPKTLQTSRSIFIPLCI